MASATKLYDLKADWKKGQFDFSDTKGKVVLIVNTASACGFTPQFEGLEKVYQKYKDQGLMVVGFPCNQFGGQDPKSNDEITSFCQVNYGVSFPVMNKVEVNGDHVHPVFQLLKDARPGLLGMTRIKWNFEKFLVDKQGEPVARYSSLTKPESIEADIERLLKQDAPAAKA
ncbi:glutathione peroxidase [Protomyces lactucae-debilis]|uniref:Glutathione peroxidase n=1 Tax=Protomyces lactucae-debilis TaxID=2754530 RepID=A0A1Y2F6H8_PROLT|nr:glutathione peroxidase [Protomyces lactucae-debilis]ORY79510.1 glutathione peroxidase [Protomyces lactucae-debilis]